MITGVITTIIIIDECVVAPPLLRGRIQPIFRLKALLFNTLRYLMMDLVMPLEILITPPHLVTIGTLSTRVLTWAPKTL